VFCATCYYKTLLHLMEFNSNVTYKLQSATAEDNSFIKITYAYSGRKSLLITYNL
jgi:hypothetical protein